MNQPTQTPEPNKVKCRICTRTPKLTTVDEDRVCGYCRNHDERLKESGDMYER